MTYEDKKQYLRAYLTSLKAAQEAARRLDEFREANAGLKAIVVSGMPHGSGTPRDLSDYVARLDDLERQFGDILKKYEEATERVLAALDKAKTDDQKRLLSLRYLDGYTFEKIAVEMGYTWRHVMRLHYEAVCDLDI